MNKFSTVILTGLSLISAISCVKENSKTENTGNFVEKQVSIEASVESPTKTSVDDDGIVYWTPKDSISVFFGDNPVLFCSYNYKPTTKAMFLGSVLIMQGNNELEGGESEDYNYWGVYPAQTKSYKYNPSRENDCVYALVDPQQTAVDGTFDRSTFVMVAQSANYQQMNFKNLCGGIRFKLSADDIEMVSFSGNNDETLGGECEVVMDGSGLPYSRAMYSNAKTIRLKAPGNTCFKPDVWYYMVSLPASLSNGFTMKFISKSKNKMATLKQSKSVNVNRSVFGSLTHPDSGLTYSEYDNSEEEGILDTKIKIKDITYDGKDFKVELEYPDRATKILAEKVKFEARAEVVKSYYDTTVNYGNYYVPFCVYDVYDYGIYEADLTSAEHQKVYQFDYQFYKDFGCGRYYHGGYLFVYRKTDNRWFMIDNNDAKSCFKGSYNSSKRSEYITHIGNSSDDRKIFFKDRDNGHDILYVLRENSENTVVFDKLGELDYYSSNESWWVDSNDRPAGIIFNAYVDGGYFNHLVYFDEKDSICDKSTVKYSTQVDFEPDSNTAFIAGRESLNRYVQFSAFSKDSKSLTELALEEYECYYTPEVIGKSVYIKARTKATGHYVMVHAWWDNGIKYEILPNARPDETQKYGDTTYGLFRYDEYTVGGYMTITAEGYSFTTVPGLYYSYSIGEGYQTINLFDLSESKRVYSIDETNYVVSYYDFLEDKFTTMDVSSSIPGFYGSQRFDCKNRDGVPYYVIHSRLASDKSYVYVWINADTGAVEVVSE